MERRSNAIWQGVQALAVLLVFGFFLYSLRDILSPFLLFWLLAAVLYPFRGTAGYSGLLVTSAALTLWWLLQTTGTLFAPFFLGLVLAYSIDPLVDRLEGRLNGRITRTVAIGVLIMPLLLAAVLLAVLGIPALAHQIGELTQQMPVLLGRVSGWAEGLRDRLTAMNVPFLEESGVLESVENLDADVVVAFIEAQRAAIVEKTWAGVLGMGRGLGTVVTILGYVVLTPVLAFYLLRDYDSITRWAADLLPARGRAEVVEFFREYDRLLSGYLRGQITVALIIGAITGLGLWIAQFPYAALVGASVAVFSVVPYLGLLLSLVPAVIIALASGSVLISLVKVAVVFGVVQALDGTLISPRIVGESVGLHPVWVVLALTVGGFFLGLIGLLVSVPIAAGIKLLVLRGLAHYRASSLYSGETRES